jgi:hypothetical protein
MSDLKRIPLSPGSTLRRPPRALLGYACLEDTYRVDGEWVPVADWRRWQHNVAVESFRHAGVEQTGLSVGQVVEFCGAGDASVGYARVTAIRMTNARSLSDREIAALDYTEDEYREFLHFENEAGWYVSLQWVDRNDDR